MDHAAIRRGALGHSRTGPTRERGADQHLAGRGAGVAHHLGKALDALAVAGEHPVDSRVLIGRRDRGVLDLDLRPIGSKLVGENGRERC
jgi:hypothetical protein